MFGKQLSLQLKMHKHLSNEDDNRVRDYLIHIRKMFPDFNNCGVDTALLKKSADFLRSKGWNLYLGENHDDRPSRYIRKS